jgi:small subunit ribosomal protein S13
VLIETWVQDWTDDQIAAIREIKVGTFTIEGELRSEIRINIKEIDGYR